MSYENMTPDRESTSPDTQEATTPSVEDRAETPSVQGDTPSEKKWFRFAFNAHYFVEIFVLTLCAVLFLTVFVMRHTVVDGASLENTLHDGKHLLISDLFYEPSRGDIVVFQSKDIEGITTPIVKRIIAVGGDKVAMKNGVVYLNGEPLDEPYVKRDGCKKSFGEILNFEEITVSEGHVFVLGDHRDNSSDSRIFGEIDARCILGRAYFCIFPFENFGLVE